jgi:hypothetical protein
MTNFELVKEVFDMLKVKKKLKKIKLWPYEKREMTLSMIETILLSIKFVILWFIVINIDEVRNCPGCNLGV